jgi:teichuronic acid biosynthesis glycosyltransferase TuaC
MRVCAITSSFPRYEGDFSGVFVYNLIAGLSKSHEIHVVYPTDVEWPGDNCESFHRHPVSYPFNTYPMAQVHGLDLINTAPLLFNMAREIRRIKRENIIDLLHAFWTIPCGFVSALCRGNVPLLTTLEGSDLEVFGWKLISRHFIKYALKRSTRIMSLSTDLKSEAIGLGADEDRISVIPDGVDTGKFKPMDKSAVRAELSLPRGFLVLYVGSLFRLKRVDMLIRICASLSKDFDFYMLVVGDGPEKQNLESSAKSLDLKNIIFKGSIPHEDMPSYMAASDVLILPSETEGLPTSVQEAMACGIPVIASNVGGISDLISNGVTGYLASNEVEMGESLREMMSSPDSVSLMGKNALDFARENLSLECVVQRIEEVYASISG